MIMQPSPLLCLIPQHQWKNLLLYSGLVQQFLLHSMCTAVVLQILLLTRHGLKTEGKSNPLLINVKITKI